MFADAPEGASKQKYSGWIAYRGVVPRAAVAEALGVDVEDSIAVMPTLWTGQDRVRLYLLFTSEAEGHAASMQHILHFPIRYGAQVNVVSTVLSSFASHYAYHFLVAPVRLDLSWIVRVSVPPDEVSDSSRRYRAPLQIPPLRWF